MNKNTGYSLTYVVMSKLDLHREVKKHAESILSLGVTYSSRQSILSISLGVTYSMTNEVIL